MNEPTLIKGGLAVDDRGRLTFVNDFNFSNVKRFYNIQNHQPKFVRAWHGHRNEGKYFFAAKGSFVVAVVKVDNWENPSKDLKVHRFVMSDGNPSILHVPAGYANGNMNLTEDAVLSVFSDKSLQESLGDDIRFPSRLWDPWSVEER